MNDLTIRRAEPGDCRLFWEWANEPGVRHASFDSTAIPWETHEAWFEAKVADPACRLFVIQTASGSPVGQVRFELEADTAVVGISVASDLRGKGYARQGLRLAVEALFQNQDIREIVAYIKPENRASQRLFESTGFRHEGAGTVKGQPALRMRLQREGR